jgi:ribosomal protein S18 acetylase RimI-like enzyme
VKEGKRMSLVVRYKTFNDKELVNSELKELWGSEIIVTPSGVYKDVDTLDGIILEYEGKFAGMILYTIQKSEMEIVEIHVKVHGIAIGSELLQHAKLVAYKNKCRRIWVSTSNDNLNAMRFYQKRGFNMINIYIGFMDEVRRYKPELPQIGIDGIPLLHLIELELIL